MVTIRDVAKKAGVGVGTVSRVLNNSNLVSQETRGKVLKVIQELDFQPNPAARRLSSGKSLSIAVVVPFFTRPSFSSRLNGVVSVLSSSPYDFIIYNVDSIALRDNFFNHMPHRDKVDGIILLSLPPFDHEAEKLAASEVPLVLVDTEHPKLNQYHLVRADDVYGGYLAAQHLLELGHRRIAYLSDYLISPYNFQSATRRYQGLLQAHEDYHVDFDPELLVQGEHGRTEARELAIQLLSMPDPPSAIFTSSDTQAVGVLEAAKRMNICIPEELSVVGFDDIEYAEVLELTTVRQMLFESGRRGIELLLQIMDGSDYEPIHETLEIELIKRKSSGAWHS